MTANDPRIIETSDGSHSIYLPFLKETYHSSHGAITESKHVFISAGLDYYLEKHNPDEIRIFEVGFGTGLNALLSLKWAEEKKVKITYHSIEQFPLGKEMFTTLNYGRLLGDEKSFLKLHEAVWDEEIQISEYFILKKIRSEWTGYKIPEAFYNVIYYDAFAPSKQPEMWSPELIIKCFNALPDGGILTTYCAQGQFKRNMTAAGFVLDVLPGPMGKKEMVRGLNPTCSWE